MSSPIAGGRESSRAPGATAQDNCFGGRGEELVKGASGSGGAKAPALELYV